MYNKKGDKNENNKKGDKNENNNGKKLDTQNKFIYS